MAKPVAKAQAVKKQWIPIVAPKVFNETWIGESLLGDPNVAIGRTLTVSMTTLTNDIQKQHVNLSFKINEFKKDVLNTELIAYHFSPSATRRFVRRARTKIDDSFLGVTADGKQLRIKPLIVTRSKAQGGVRAGIHKAAREFFILQLSKMKLEAFWNELLSHNLQKALGESLRKIYPLSSCEVRWVFVAGEGVPPVIAEEIKKEETTEEILEDAIADAETVAQ